MVSIIFIWEISQELSEPYQSAVTKVIVQGRGVWLFHSSPAFEWTTTTSSIRPVCSLFFVGFFFCTFIFFKKKTLWESTSINKRLREKGTCNTVLWNHTHFYLTAIDLNAPKAKLHVFSFVSICGLYWTWWQASYRLHSIVHVAMETTKTSHLTCQSNSFISIFFTFQVLACELQPFSCLDLANDIYSQTAKIVFSHLKWFSND